MNEWEVCAVCRLPNAEGLLICYACAARMIAEQRQAGWSGGVMVDGVWVARPIEEKKPRGNTCPACSEPTLVWTRNGWRCETCGYTEV